MTALIPVAAGHYLASSPADHVELASVAVSSTPSTIKPHAAIDAGVPATTAPTTSTTTSAVPPVPSTTTPPPTTPRPTTPAPTTPPTPATTRPPTPAATTPPATTATPATTTAPAATPSSYGCGPAVAYLSVHSAPGFVFECPGNALGHQAMTCENVAGVCPGAKIIAIADPCAAAYMNEANNSWVISGLRKGTIDPYGYCS